MIEKISIQLIFAFAILLLFMIFTSVFYINFKKIHPVSFPEFVEPIG